MVGERGWELGNKIPRLSFAALGITKALLWPHKAMKMDGGRVLDSGFRPNDGWDRGLVADGGGHEPPPLGRMSSGTGFTPILTFPHRGGRDL